MSAYFSADAKKIASHKQYLLYETQLARDLLTAVKKLEQYPDIQTSDRYRLIVRDAKKLLDFSKKMEDFSEVFTDQVLQASRQIGLRLKEASDTLLFEDMMKYRQID